jgi:serine O-acetyltransferase
MDELFLNKLYKEHQDAAQCPNPRAIIKFFEETLGLLFPDFSEQSFEDIAYLRHFADKLHLDLLHLIKDMCAFSDEKKSLLVADFFDQLPVIKEKLLLDIKAMYEGDPAAKSHTEVIKTYPGFYAIAAYRLAHELYIREIDLLPRTISEYAHSKTGIDIHPGATIGLSFCIDHGTGIVIGETTVIGDYVKIYQGVTLGALSVNKADALNKRHPTIEDHVVIYAGASILGGKTVIGHDSVIGGNVWLTQSVPPASKIYYKATMSNEDGLVDVITFKN